MCDLVARTGRHQQRYEAGCRLVAGCIPFRYRNCDDTSDDKPGKEIEVLMINSPSGPGLLFPKGGWENDETVEEAAAREALEEAGVRGNIVVKHHLTETTGLCDTLKKERAIDNGINTLKKERAIDNGFYTDWHVEYGDMYPNKSICLKTGTNYSFTYLNGREHLTRLHAVLWSSKRVKHEGDVSFLGDYYFKSKTLQDEFSPEGLCKAAVFVLQVTEELESWPEQSTRQRSWVTFPEAVEQCRHPWMRDALLEGFSKWHDGINTRPQNQEAAIPDDES